MLPSPFPRQVLQVIEAGDLCYDPVESMLLMPMPVRSNVHAEHLDDTPRHPVHQSLTYALCLLEIGDEARMARAEKIIGRVLDLQDTADPEAKTYGLWPYFMEEPVPVWPWPDFNWADFNATTLLIAWHRHGARLSVSLAERVRTAFKRAAICIRRRNVDLNHTNIALKGIFVTLSAAEVLGDADLRAYALDRLARLRALIAAGDSFAKYNSPTYAAISLAALHAIDTYVKHPAARRDVAPLLARFWNEVALRLHPRTRELAGPHARAYAPSLAAAPDLLGALIERATGGAIRLADDASKGHFPSVYGCVIDVKPPTEVVAMFLARPTEPREVVVTARTGPADAPRAQTTWLAPEFCLGSISFQNGWEQRHNFIAHWPSSAGENGFLRDRYLRDDRPCCSGHFVSRQQGGAVAAGVFLAAYADHHVSIPVEGVNTSFLGTVLELDASSEALRAWCGGEEIRPGAKREVRKGEIVRVDLSAIVLEWRWREHIAHPGEAAQPRVERIGADRIRFVLPHYEGPRRWLRWLDFDRAVSAYALRIAQRGEPLPVWLADEPALPETTPPSQAAVEAWGLAMARGTACVQTFA